MWVCVHLPSFGRMPLKKPTSFLSKAQSGCLFIRKSYFILQVTHQGHLALEQSRKPRLSPTTCLKNVVVIRYSGCYPQASGSGNHADSRSLTFYHPSQLSPRTHVNRPRIPGQDFSWRLPHDSCSPAHSSLYISFHMCVQRDT